MITPFRGTPVGLSTLTSTPTTHASTRVGDFLVLAVHGFWATSLGTGGHHHLRYPTSLMNQRAALDVLLAALETP